MTTGAIPRNRSSSRPASRRLTTPKSAIIRSLEAGSYTAIVRGKDCGTGVALIEVYNL
jgi:hypothetical protein